MSDLALALRQVRYEQRSFWRNPASAVFTFAFPLLFLVIFATLNANQTITERGGLDYATFYVPGIVAFGLISACYVNLAIRIAVARDLGILKRVRGTPLPAWAYVAGQVGSSLVTTVVLVSLTIAMGALAYGVRFRPDTLPALLLALGLGAVCFCALGLAMSSVCPNADAAPAVVNFSVFPLLFISGIFFPLDTAPDWMRSFAKLFPIEHLAAALQIAFDPRTDPPGVSRTDLALLLIWAVIGVWAAVNLFRWESRRT